MGACLSCLGLNQAETSSQDGDLDRILNSEQRTYGATESDGLVQPDEEELRREREALEHITANAADHMIDILHPSQSELDCGLTDHHHHNHNHNANPTYEPIDQGDKLASSEDAEDAEAAAWLESIQSEQLDAIQLPQGGTLVMDIGLLRDTQQRRKVRNGSVF